MQYAADAWTCAGVRVCPAEANNTASAGELPSLCCTATGAKLTHLHLRWNGRAPERSLLVLGDAWERSYGDLEWRGIVPERVLPWYFLSSDGTHVEGFGVKTQPGALCFWQRDTEGITLTLDLRNGGGAAELGCARAARVHGRHV